MLLRGYSGPTLVTRGERLAMYRMRWIGDGLGSGESEVEALEVDEVDADGRLIRAAFFNPDDLQSTQELLEAWYEGAPED